MSKWTPERKKHQADKMTAHWAALTPQERAGWIQNSTNALRSDEGRKAISDGTKAAYKRPEVKKNLSEGLKNKVWKDNDERRDQARETAKKILCDPEIVAQARAAHATPKTSKAISEGNTRSWAKDTKRKEKTSEQFKELWAKRKAELAEAWRPADWWDKPGDYRVIGTELMAKDYMSNKELGKRLDANKLIKCPYGDSWEEALSGPGRAANRVSEVRKWMKRPGKTAA